MRGARGLDVHEDVGTNGGVALIEEVPVPAIGAVLRVGERRNVETATPITELNLFEGFVDREEHVAAAVLRVEVLEGDVARVDGVVRFVAVCDRATIRPNASERESR